MVTKLDAADGAGIHVARIEDDDLVAVRSRVVYLHEEPAGVLGAVTAAMHKGWLRDQSLGVPYLPPTRAAHVALDHIAKWQPLLSAIVCHEVDIALLRAVPPGVCGRELARTRIGLVARQ